LNARDKKFKMNARNLLFHLGRRIACEAGLRKWKRGLTDPKNTGGLIELRFFEQGTWSARWIPLGNLYANSNPSQTPTPQH
jgi:hypothetical protein